MLCQEEEAKRNAESEITILVPTPSLMCSCLPPLFNSHMVSFAQKTLGNHPNLIGYFGSAK
jgi:hypothetical protein